MDKNELILQDRIEKIQEVVGKYGEENFSISFSGGKDSTVLSALVDLALPGNHIPRVFADTGIEYQMIRNFVLSKAETDDRFVMLHPSIKIKEMLETEGYPFKSKKHSGLVSIWQKYHTLEGRLGLQHYLSKSEDGRHWSPFQTCPKKLEYQFTEDFNLKVSDRCCFRLKEEPLANWEKENHKPYSMIGLMREEGGRRKDALCTVFSRGKLQAFQPLVMVSKEWEDWFIEQYKIEICEIYRDPYNFNRTGCKGCPFSLKLQEQLDIMEKYFPEERKQCEIIWKPVYDEYRRIGYRLKK